ncbi:hypothetical protein NDU88_006103 [Pleurodeles waltl]|uniref:Uncharacterized protein n=1 Tax=Pleurodeles waltl TaxID=8319 RepID=A0AAV7RKZ7_PLEWA|nr:hypothetical protein NDU88_006103 [Pleurodeles waltl]
MPRPGRPWSQPGANTTQGPGGLHSIAGPKGEQTFTHSAWLASTSVHRCGPVCTIAGGVGLLHHSPPRPAPLRSYRDRPHAATGAQPSPRSLRSPAPSKRVLPLLARPQDHSPASTAVPPGSVPGEARGQHPDSSSSSAFSQGRKFQPSRVGDTASHQPPPTSSRPDRPQSRPGSSATQGPCRFHFITGPEGNGRGPPHTPLGGPAPLFTITARSVQLPGRGRPTPTRPPSAHDPLFSSQGGTPRYIPLQTGPVVSGTGRAPDRSSVPTGDPHLTAGAPRPRHQAPGPDEARAMPQPQHRNSFSSWPDGEGHRRHPRSPGSTQMPYLRAPPPHRLSGARPSHPAHLRLGRRPPCCLCLLPGFHRHSSLRLESRGKDSSARLTARPLSSQDRPSQSCRAMCSMDGGE